MRFLKWLGYAVAGLIGAVICFVFCVHFFTFIRAQGGHEVILHIRGENINGCGIFMCPTSWGIAYDIDTVDVKNIDPELLSKVGSSYDSMTKYIKQFPEGLPVYLPLAESKDGIWGMSGLVTTDKQKISSLIFIRGILNGGGGWVNQSGTERLESVGVSFPHIASSLAIAPFVDFGGVYAKDDTQRAVIVLDNDGNPSFKEFRVGEKTCISVWRTISFDNTDCWRNYRKEVAKPKNYLFSFPYLVIQKVFSLFEKDKIGY